MTMSNKGNGPQIFADEKRLASILNDLNTASLCLNSAHHDSMKVPGAMDLGWELASLRNKLNEAINSCLSLKCAAEDAVNQNV
jgi:hypothetical protein